MAALGVHSEGGEGLEQIVQRKLWVEVFEFGWDEKQPSSGGRGWNKMGFNLSSTHQSVFLWTLQHPITPPCSLCPPDTSHFSPCRAG